MATWHSRGLRGSTFEDLINRTNDIYQNSNLCLIQKIPTPITPINIDKDTRHITLAYFDKKSTVDYIGVVQGIPVCFDAKECHSDLFPLQNIHEHQLSFMQAFEQQQGIAFLLLYFTERDEFYYLRLSEAMRYWNRALERRTKKLSPRRAGPGFLFSAKPGLFVPYLDPLQLDLSLRDA